MKIIQEDYFNTINLLNWHIEKYLEEGYSLLSSYWDNNKKVTIYHFAKLKIIE